MMDPVIQAEIARQVALHCEERYYASATKEQIGPRLVIFPGKGRERVQRTALLRCFGEVSMFFVVIGTDHSFQHSEAGFRGLLDGLTSMNFFEPLTAIAEEFHEDIGDTSVAKELAMERGVPWFNLDMTNEEMQDAGILQEQRERPKSQGNVAYRVFG